MVSKTSNKYLDMLLRAEPYESDVNTKQKLFNDALLIELKFHYDNNLLYRNFCNKHNFDPHTFFGTLDEIPSIPAQIFKLLGNDLYSIERQDITLTLNSSATSGVPSSVVLDRITSIRQTRAMVRVISNFIGSSRLPFLVLDADPSQSNRASYGARRAAIHGYLNFASSVKYYFTYDSDHKLVFNKKTLVNDVNELKNDASVILFGFTFVLYIHVVKQFLENNIRLALPKGSKILHIGGWKKLDDQKVDRTTFNEDVAYVFGINPNDIIDIYGFTEQMGINFPDCEYGWRHIPVFSDVIVRDPVTMKPLPHDEAGLLEFVSPLPHSYPGNVVQTDDIGVVDKHESCKCGRIGKKFKVTGRADKAEVRGCGDVMSHEIISLNDMTNNTVSTKSGLKILLHPYNLSNNLNDIDLFKRLVSDIQKNQQWLSEQPVDALIGLINQARIIWSSEDFELHGFRKNGLAFLNQWCASQSLRALSDFSLRNRRGYLDGLQYIDNSTTRMITARPRGLVSHWLSGNVPVLGMLVIVQSIITKNLNLVKVASSYSHVVPILLKAFKGLSFKTPGGYVIYGDDLLKTISVFYYDHNDIAILNHMSQESDVRLAWGGAEAINAVASTPARWDVQDVFFGPKISYMAIGAESLDSSRSIRRLCRRASTDISVFDQTACASPHTIFVERGGSITPKEFADQLSQELQKALARIPRDTDSKEQIFAINLQRSLYEFKGEVWSSDDSSWTVLYDEEEGLAVPTYGRVILVRPVDDIFDTIKYASNNIQTISLSIKGRRRLLYAERVFAKGVQRCPDIGRMTHFESPWDGIIVMDRFVKWCTLGGPV
jgi:hypothetical protein